MSLTEMKGVHIFYLHCTCYKFRIAVLIFDRINAVCAKSLDISRSVFIIWRKQYQLIQQDLFSKYSTSLDHKNSLLQTNTRLFGEDITISFGTFAFSMCEDRHRACELLSYKPIE